MHAVLWRKNPAQNCSISALTTALSPEIAFERPEVGVLCLPAEVSQKNTNNSVFSPPEDKELTANTYLHANLYHPNAHPKPKLTCRNLQALIKLEHTSTSAFEHFILNCSP